MGNFGLALSKSGEAIFVAAILIMDHIGPPGEGT
jgi:hypothetical protein